MSQVRSVPSTLREKSTWTPKNFPPSNEKVGLYISRWHSHWSEVWSTTHASFIEILSMISVHEPECKLVWKALPSMIQIFKERMTLIKKWYAAWNESQRWTLLEYVLRQQDDEKLTVIHDLLHPVLPSPDHDFTRVLPRCLCLRIFSLLDPQSLCRAAQVILVAVYKRYICIVLMKHKRHHSTSTHVHTHTRTHLSLIHIWRCRRSTLCRSRWSPYH